MSSNTLIVSELKRIIRREQIGMYAIEAQDLVAQELEYAESYLQKIQNKDIFTLTEYNAFFRNESELLRFQQIQASTRADDIINNISFLLNNIELFDWFLWQYLYSKLVDSIFNEDLIYIESKSPPLSMNDWYDHIVNETTHKIQKLKSELEQLTYFSSAVHTPFFQNTFSFLNF